MIKRICVYYVKLQHFKKNLRLVLKLKNTLCKLNQRQWLKNYIELNSHKRIEANIYIYIYGYKDRKALHKLIKNAVDGKKKRKKMRIRTDVRLVSNKKVYLKWASQPSYASKKIDQKLVVLHKINVTLKLNEPAYVEMCVLYFNKVLIYEFQYYYIKNKYGNNSG